MTLFQIGVSYRFECDTNIAPQSSLRHSCASEEVGVNKQIGTTEVIFLSDPRRSVRQPTKRVKMKMTGFKLRINVNFKTHVKEKMNKISGFETW